MLFILFLKIYNYIANIKNVIISGLQKKINYIYKQLLNIFKRYLHV